MVQFPRILPSLALAVFLSAPICSTIVKADDMAPPAPAPAPAPAAPAPDAAAPAPAPAPAPAAAPDAAAPATPAPADTAPPAAAPPAAPAAPVVSDEQKALNDVVDDFWHFGKVARYDLAADAGAKALTTSTDAAAILTAFETVSANHKDILDQWILKWRSLPPIPNALAANNPSVKAEQEAVDKMKDITAKLDDKINEGYELRRTSPQFIHDTIVAMSQGQRAYDNNFPRLAKSGELAVKVLVDMLHNPSDRALNNTVRRALVALGRKAMNPLLAATEMKDPATLVDVIAALGEIGYDASVPYLSRISTAANQPQAVRSAATAALTKMGAANVAGVNPAAQFYDLAEKFYYGNASVTSSPDKVSYIWYWNENHGLEKIDVPSPIFDDLMAMRACEYALKIDANRGDAVSLWLAADTKREVDLPTGAEDPSHKGNPDAHYYNVSAGVKYLNDALARTIHDRNSGVTLKLVQSLQDIIGGSNMGSANDPVTQALFFPNRLVRYEAAFALAESLPTKQFNGIDRVVPLLAEALSQTSKPNVLIVAPEGQVNLLQEAVQGLGYPVVSATDVSAGINSAASLPAVDVIVTSEGSDVPRLLEQAGQTPRLQGASVLVMTKVPTNPYTVRAATDPLMNSAVMPPKEGLAATMKAEIDRARIHAGATPLTDAQASEYGLRAADILSKLAICRDQILDLTVAEGPIIAALNDPRPEIAKAVGTALSMFKTRTAQNGIAARALDEATPAEVRVSLFKSLANSAKFFGNTLDARNVAALEKVVTDNKNADVRGAAAEARGALNLPSSAARTLIVGQSKI